PGCWCALTLRLAPAPFHPYPGSKAVAVCFLLHCPGPSAVAQKERRPRTVGVTHHRVLWSPDFPPPGRRRLRKAEAGAHRATTVRPARRLFFHCTASPAPVATGGSPLGNPEDHRKAAEVSCRRKAANLTMDTMSAQRVTQSR